MKPFIRTAAKRTLIDTEESVGLRNQQVKKIKTSYWLEKIKLQRNNPKI